MKKKVTVARSNSLHYFLLAAAAASFVTRTGFALEISTSNNNITQKTCEADDKLCSVPQEEQEYEGLDWPDLPESVREELVAEGWTAESWDQEDVDVDDDSDEYGDFDDEDFHTIESKSWDELLPETRRHYETRGYTRETWDMEETPYAELDWNEISTHKQQALETLGWTADGWDAPNRRFFRPASEKKPWRNLTEVEKKAAVLLGHTEGNWHVRSLGGFSPVVTHLPIPELQALNLDYLAQLDDVKVLVRDGLTLGDDEHCDTKTMTMKEYIGELRKGWKYYLKYEDEESYKKYIQSIIGPKVLHHMGQALRNSELRKNGSFSKEYDDLPLTDYNWAFWVGGTNTTTSMHYDTDSLNFLWVAEGRKRVVMMPNDERTAGKYECLSQYWEHSCWTGIDILSGPLPEHAVEVELGPGDGIMFPFMCWHAVQNLEPTVAYGYRIDLAEFAK